MILTKSYCDYIYRKIMNRIIIYIILKIGFFRNQFNLHDALDLL